MRNFRELTTAIFLSLSLGLVPQAYKQNTTDSSASAGEVVIAMLSSPVYPPIARQLHITGDVEVTIDVTRDGVIQSSRVTSGPPLLYDASLESAIHTKYWCENCGQSGASLRLVYSFRLVPDPEDPCNPKPTGGQSKKPESHFSEVNVRGTHIELIEQAPKCNIDNIEIRTSARSIKCLYLWRCTRR